MADWITADDVAGYLDLPASSVAGDDNLALATAAVKAAVERRRSDLDFTADDFTVVNADVRTGSIRWAGLMYQARNAPSGYAGYGDDTTLLNTLGANRAEIMRPRGLAAAGGDVTSPTATAAGTRAIEALVAALVEAGVEATRDAGAFYPQPAGVLVGLPTLVSRGIASHTFTVPVLVVSGDPLNATPAVDRIYALADDVAHALDESNYRPSSWRSSVNAEPLPAIELTVTVTVTEGG